MFALELELDNDPARLAARPAHRQLLADLHGRGLLVLAGPWPDDTGALLILDTDEAGVKEILAADPYYALDSVRVRSVREWHPIFRP